MKLPLRWAEIVLSRELVEEWLVTIRSNPKDLRIVEMYLDDKNDAVVVRYITRAPKKGTKA